MSVGSTSMAGGLLGSRVRRAMQGMGYQPLSQIDCEADGNTVTLRGEMPSYYLYQIAQTVALKVPGVHQIRNEIVVTPEPTSDTDGRRGTSEP